MNPLNFLSLVILGTALLWAVRLAYGVRRGAAADAVKQCMVVGGWMLILLGVFLFTAAFGMGAVMFAFPVMVVVILATLHRYREAERNGLMWTLAYAAERNLPLATAARAFAQERTDELGQRSGRLAEALEAGLPLDAALKVSRNSVPLHVLVAVRVGSAYGNLSEALRSAVSQSRDFDRVLRSVLERVLLLLVGLFLFLMITVFVMIKIVPTMERMFYEFEMVLPAPTRLLVAVSQLVAYNGVYLWPVFPLTILALILGTLHYVGWLPWNLPGLGWLRMRYDRTVLLRSLALTVQEKRPLEESLRGLESMFPTYVMRRRLQRALRSAQQGTDPLIALRQAGLVTNYEFAVLAAAQRVGNLPWALGVMADNAVQRLTRRVRRFANCLVALLFVSLSGLVLLFAVAMIMPLATMVLNLS